MAVKITLSGDGLNYETDADMIKAAKIIGFLNMDGPLQGSAPTSYSATNDTSFIGGSARNLASPREVILESGAKTNPQKILVLGKYLEERDGVETFLPNELRAIFAKAGEPAPKNLGRDVEAAVRQGYITEDPEVSGQYLITNTGYKALEDKFSSAKSKHAGSSSNKSASRTRSVKVASDPEWLKGVAVEDQLDDFPNYRTMDKRSDKILWILQWGQANGRDRLTGLEVSVIADKLADNVPSKQVAAATATYLAKGYVSKTSDGYKILHNGTQLLKAPGE